MVNTTTSADGSPLSDAGSERSSSWARRNSAWLVTVVGSPGVGKTRLVSEAQTVLASRAQVVDLRIDRTGGATFAPVGELVRRVVGLADDDGGLRERIAAWIGDDGDPETLAPLLATLVDVGSPRSTEESFFASRRLVEILTARRPLMLVIDDIQWAPKLFLDLIWPSGSRAHCSSSVSLDPRSANSGRR